jgi:hypothetical protein
VASTTPSTWRSNIASSRSRPQMRVTAGLADEHHVAARTAASIAPRIISPAS